MNRYLNKALERTYAASRTKCDNKTMIDLALKSYYADFPPDTDRGDVDAEFKKYALSQIKLFIFGGHDTTAATICYTFLCLSRNPSALETLRAEHDEILGTDTKATSKLLIEQPTLLNKLPYTLAVIKETLRLFALVTSPRAGQADIHLTDAHRRIFPTEHCIVWSVHQGLHTDPAYWPRVQEFLPERFLVAEDDPLYPIKGAWRPFEQGPRNCVGQELALMEVKIVLTLVVREFDVRDAYKEWDEMKGKGKVKTVEGERAYGVQMGSARPSDGFPAKASFAKR